MTLSSTTCLVTGCSSGIGRALAHALSDAGAAVHATARRPQDVRQLAELGFNAHQLDVTDSRQVVEVVTAIQPLDVVINNAGIGVEGAVEEVEDEELRAVFDVNVFGVWRICRAALPDMRRRRGGTIVNISSFGGEVPYPGMGAYRASKFALEGLSWTLRLELADLGIRVLDVQPGLVESGFGDRMISAGVRSPDGPYAAMHAAAARSYPRMSPTALSPDAVAAAVVSELAAPSGRFRLPVGEDAERMIRAVRAGDEQFEQYLRADIGFAWNPATPISTESMA